MHLPGVLLPFLDASFLILLVGNLAKAGELVLDSSQQLRVQRFLDAVTLRLIDLNILKWYPRLRESKFNLPIFLLIILVQLLLIARVGKLSLAHGATPYVLIFTLELPVYLFYISLLSRIRWAWLFCVFTLTPMLIGFRILWFGLMVFFGWAKAITDFSHNNSQQLDLRTIEVTLLIAAFVLLFALTTFILSVVLTWLGVMVSSCYLAVIFIRGLMWRIVTYSKGAWAAVLVLVTALIGGLDALLRAKLL